MRTGATDSKQAVVQEEERLLRVCCIDSNIDDLRHVGVLTAELGYEVLDRYDSVFICLPWKLKLTKRVRSIFFSTASKPSTTSLSAVPGLLPNMMLSSQRSNSRIFLVQTS